jgi:hypothetical protein
MARNDIPSIGGPPSAFASPAATTSTEEPLLTPVTDSPTLVKEWLLENPCPATDDHKKRVAAQVVALARDASPFLGYVRMS